MVAVVDYGVGNMFSIRSSLRYLGIDCVVTDDAAELAGAQRIILPGVGAFGDAADKLRARGLDEALKQEAAKGKPLLGICLGMQLLYEESLEFGRHEGLGLLEGTVRPLSEVLDTENHPIPHIGWNFLEPDEAMEGGSDCELLRGIEPGTAVYYVHSFYAPVDERQTCAWSAYGPARVSGVVRRGRVFGTQFHPEKSGEKGLRMLAAFCGIE